MNNIGSSNVADFIATQNKVLSSSGRTNQTASNSSLTVEIMKDPCGCSKIQGQYHNCNGEDIAQSIVYLADSLASLVGAKNAGEVLIDLSEREDFNILHTSQQGGSNV